MKVVSYIALSVDGYVADASGDESFLSDEHWKTFLELIEAHKACVMGKSTYDLIQTWGAPYFKDLSRAELILLSRTPAGNSVGSPHAALAKAGELGYSSVVVVGPTVNALFANAGLINELIASIEPAAIGKGIAAFNSLLEKPLRLRLARTETSPEHGIVRVHYTVI